MWLKRAPASPEHDVPIRVRLLSHLAVIAASLVAGGLAGSFALTVRLCLTWYVGMAAFVSLWIAREKFGDGRAHWTDNLLIALILIAALVLLWH
jgi:hypothetical protein